MFLGNVPICLTQCGFMYTKALTFPNYMRMAILVLNIYSFTIVPLICGLV